MDQPRNYDPYGGFSIVGVILSDALPAACYHPDVLAKIYEETRKAEEKQRLDEE